MCYIYLGSLDVATQRELDLTYIGEASHEKPGQKC
jgi:hypothetical protein